MKIMTFQNSECRENRMVENDQTVNASSRKFYQEMSQLKLERVIKS